MNKKEKQLVNMAHDLVNIFTDYSYTLDNYFKDDKNKDNHKELYIEYKFFNQNLQKIAKKYGGSIQ